MRRRVVSGVGFCFLMLLCVLSNHPVAIAQGSQKASSLLSAKQQSIVLISAFTVTGDLEKLKPALHAALDSKVTVNEAKEVIVHLYAYSGFPRSIKALTTLMAVLDERKAKGITDEMGKEASVVPNTANKYDVGKRNLENLTGVPQGKLSGYNAFSPEIDRFLKEHLFADIFERDVLTYAERELATVSALTALGKTEPMLSSHKGLAIRQGITEDQLSEAASLINKSTNSNLLFPKGQARLNPNMTGTVYVQNVIEHDSLMATSVGSVTFEPGARTNWHSHFAGQILLVTDGIGYHQIKGKPVEIIKKGDAIRCPPNVEHWHGASHSSGMTHVAITQNTGSGRVTWLKKVTDEEYAAAKLD